MREEPIIEIVISPLINLVKDQVRRLSLLGVSAISLSDISSLTEVKKVESGEFPKDHLNLGLATLDAINRIISPPYANLGIIVATNPENRNQAEQKKRIKKTTADHAEFTSSDDKHAESTSSDDEFFSQAWIQHGQRLSS